MNQFPPPCIHGDGANLCADCQADYDYDPLAYIEFGKHPAGQERWRELQQEIADYQAENANVESDPNLPF